VEGLARGRRAFHLGTVRPLGRAVLRTSDLLRRCWPAHAAQQSASVGGPAAPLTTSLLLKSLQPVETWRLPQFWLLPFNVSSSSRADGDEGVGWPHSCFEAGAQEDIPPMQSGHAQGSHKLSRRYPYAHAGTPLRRFPSVQLRSGLASLVNTLCALPPVSSGSPAQQWMAFLHLLTNTAPGFLLRPSHALWRLGSLCRPPPATRAGLPT